MYTPAEISRCIFLKVWWVVLKKYNLHLLVLPVLVFAGAVAWYSYYSLTFVALAHNDAMDYASMARNVARGEGFISSYITPLGLAHKGLPHPDLWRAPAWPAALAVFIGVLGATDQAVAIASGFFYLAAIPLVFLLARYWFGRIVGAAAVLIYIFSARNLGFSISGLTEPMALFMMALTVYILAMPSFRNRRGDFILGIAAGAFYLTRYNALLFVPVIALYWWWLRKPAGIQAVARYGAAFILTVLPWAWRNYSITGSPLFSLQKYEPVMFTKTYPGYSLYMMPEKVDVPGFMRSHWPEILDKIRQNWLEFAGHLFDPAFTGVNVVLFALFLLALVIPFNERQRGVRPFLLICFGLQLAALMVIHYIPRLFFMFMPFYAIYGAAAVSEISQRVARGRGFAVVAVLALTIFFVAGNLPDWREPNVREPLLRNYAGSIREVMFRAKRGELILSNDGHLLAWYGDRYAAKLPYSVDMLPELEKIAPVKMIYLSGRMSWNMPEADDSWRRVFWGRPLEFDGFRLLKRFPDGSLVYVKKY
jgi:4-amino-4-deoxy-L-arabinose transferase-like glycosyltransferase